MTRIYTKKGDKGLTGLANGDSIPKTDPRICLLGALDEANAALGVVFNLLFEACHSAEAASIRRIQGEIFELGATVSRTNKTMTPLEVDHLEKWIDLYDTNNVPLKNFILPGGNPISAQLHVARGIVRRVETLLLPELQIPAYIGIYLNRLSDLLFVLARHTNKKGERDVIWTPK